MNNIGKKANQKTRKILLTLGILLFIIGLSLFIIAIVSTFSFNDSSLFFLAFIGLPLLPVGFICIMLSLMGKIQRYIINETVENTADATNYVLKENKDDIKDIIKNENIKRCPNCNDIVSESEMYCDKCGTKLTRTCPHCGENITNHLSEYCPKCGAKL